MEGELTPEQIRMQEINALTGMPWWDYLVEDFKDLIEKLDKNIFDIEAPDTPTHSLKSICIAQRNCLQTMIDKPSRVIETLKTIK